MSEKYKLQELARDLGLGSKEVTDLLGQHFENPKKNTASLNREELDVVFEQLTQERQEKDFDRYFAAKEYQMIDRADPEKPKKAVKTKAPVEKSSEPASAAAVKKPEETPVLQNPEPKKEQPKASAPVRPAVQTVSAGGQTFTIRMPGAPKDAVPVAVPVNKPEEKSAVPVVKQEEKPAASVAKTETKPTVPAVKSEEHPAPGIQAGTASGGCRTKTGTASSGVCSKAGGLCAGSKTGSAACCSCIKAGDALSCSGSKASACC